MSKKGTTHIEKKGEEQEESFIKVLLTSYSKETPSRLKMIDCFLIYQLITAALVLVYGFFFCHNPLNAFLAALFSCAGMFVFTMSLRLHESEEGSSKKYFVEYVFCVILLQLSVANFLG
ncbi:defender against cell death protein, putative [Entamoeba histolytica HM-1:IMSS-B]|uniref:Dolichyl-diphosphooligosaccharide--protein glycosyltransferase subunit OST2 n=8 Tax=Entamoeba TaxID=5758 RepID=C4LVM0_ENTH1|nr:defender against cell death protein, putative [Entamoeba nuttalli P19]XP_653360.1 defender against cell death protein, putative [Entamoeba histolytica HM-1:IMSS]EMD44109.1 defender against cell death protein, putative [Entamoeba histolytica KU27]EMH75572.1 defender against cell death protein, putative [Entamoeba histolytica HM-1:IMSS-B]EMS11230.1 defender against cell death protein [Entamoeba histolytica HM-3:IMSS]ENY64565.1 defender against cell death protein, putative [Entamoeba histolyti|eukprot:XP_008858605.1 defender against cell death protein, putative [Entamoeba nuttalli P19]